MATLTGFEYSFLKDCKNDCYKAGETDCPDGKFDCMCKDKDYVFAGLCCVLDTCGPVDLLTAERYIFSYCEEWRTPPPNMDQLDCSTTTTSASSSTTKTTTSSGASKTSTGQKESESADGGGGEGGGGGSNVGTIAGIAGGAVALVLLIAGLYFFGWRKRRNEKKVARPSPSNDPPFTKESYPEAVKLSELSLNQPSPAPTELAHNQARVPELYPSVHPSTSYSPLANGYSYELGTQGGRPHGFELPGPPPPLPPRVELQGMPDPMRSHRPNDNYWPYGR